MKPEELFMRSLDVIPHLNQSLGTLQLIVQIANRNLDLCGVDPESQEYREAWIVIDQLTDVGVTIWNCRDHLKVLEDQARVEFESVH